MNDHIELRDVKAMFLKMIDRFDFVVADGLCLLDTEIESVNEDLSVMNRISGRRNGGFAIYLFVDSKLYRSFACVTPTTEFIHQSKIGE